jgi:hypothetical protein
LKVAEIIRHSWSEPEFGFMMMQDQASAMGGGIQVTITDPIQKSNGDWFCSLLFREPKAAAMHITTNEVMYRMVGTAYNTYNDSPSSIVIDPFEGVSVMRERVLSFNCYGPYRMRRKETILEQQWFAQFSQEWAQTNTASLWLIASQISQNGFFSWVEGTIIQTPGVNFDYPVMPSLLSRLQITKWHSPVMTPEEFYDYQVCAIDAGHLILGDPRNPILI